MMKVWFRPNKELFDESMAQAEEFNSMRELLQKHGPATVIHYAHDDRLKAKTFIVESTKRKGILGYCWFVYEDVL